MDNQRLLSLFATPEESPERVAWESQRSLILDRAINELGLLQQLVLLLRYRLDYTYAAIAAEMHTSEAAVHAMIGRILARLQADLATKGIHNWREAA
jgi:RNA polymerase sigma factor (sigma-70 family)